jgi:hypothetical protein
MKNMRYINITVILLLVYITSFGQVRTKGKQRSEWSFSMGPSVGMMDGRLLSPVGYGAMFKPRFTFGAMGRESSASLEMPITLLSFKQKYGADSIVNQGFSVNIPFLLDFNFYHGAFKRPDKTFGLHFGGGWNFNYMSFSTARTDVEDPSRDVKTNYEGLNHGVYLDGGIRFGFKTGVSLDVRVYANITFQSPELSLYGVALVYDFGMKKRSLGQGSGWY